MRSKVGRSPLLLCKIDPLYLSELSFIDIVNIVLKKILGLLSVKAMVMVT